MLSIILSYLNFTNISNDYHTNWNINIFGHPHCYEFAFVVNFRTPRHKQFIVSNLKHENTCKFTKYYFNSNVK